MKYRCVMQHDTTDCGAACLATICKQYGFKISLSKIRELAGTDKEGTNVYGIVQAAEQIGFAANAVKCDEERFFSGIPLPCIAHVVVDGDLLHYIVIHKVTSKEIIIADPAKGIVKISHKDFFGHGKESIKYRWTGILILATKKDEFNEEYKKKSILFRFFQLLIPQKKWLFKIFLTSIIYIILGISVAFYYQILVDKVLVDESFQRLCILSVIAIVLNIVRVLMSTLRSYFVLYFSQNLDKDLLLGYYKHLLKLPIDFFGKRKLGEIVSRFMDASKVREALSGATLTVMIDILMIAVGAAILSVENIAMFGVALGVISCYAIIVVGFNKKYRELTEQQMEDNAQLNSYLVESLNGIQTVKAYNAECNVLKETENRFEELLHSIFKRSTIENVQNSLKTLVELIGGIVILWVGGVYVLNGMQSIGQLITFYSLMNYFMDPVKNIINLQPQMQTAVVAAERLGEILELEVEKKEDEEQKMKPDSLKGDIIFRNVDFRYGRRRLVLKGIDIQIKSGQNVAFVGESGSGKTTLSKLLLHFYTLEKGMIQIGEQDINRIQIEVLRDKIAYIPQEIFLFSGSILENLTLGLECYSEEDILEATKRAQAHEFIMELPLGYKTRLEENGANLSGGQKQRLAIARAMLKKPSILILDEATSNLDAITERALDVTIREFCKDMTTIFIAHRLSTIKNCDNIFVMDKGEIVESGTHEELCRKGGKYAELVRQQSLDV